MTDIEVVPEEDQAPHGVPLSCSLADLETFMTVTRTALKKPLKEGDYDGLVEVMGHLMKVKERQVATDSMFEPLKQTIELLKSYGEEMPEEIYLKLQVGPNRAALEYCVRSLPPRCLQDSGSPGVLRLETASSQRTGPRWSPRLARAS